MNKYSAEIRLATNRTQKVTVEADDSQNARLMLEAQYGDTNVASIFRIIPRKFRG